VYGRSKCGENDERNPSCDCGEGNGDIIFPELHYGRDAMVGIALFLTHLAKSDKLCSILRSSYPDYTIAKKKLI
jgi:phosphomannomutase